MTETDHYTAGVAALVHASTAALRFYDNLDRLHDKGEPEVLDALQRAVDGLRALSPTSAQGYAPAVTPSQWEAACEVAEQVWLSGDERADARLKFRDAIEAAIKMLGAPAQGWRDIASAPRDGTHVLVAGFSWRPHQAVAHWGSTTYNRSKRAYNKGWTAIPGVELLPTHWMPLPEPPAPQRVEGGS